MWLLPKGRRACAQQRGTRRARAPALCARRALLRRFGPARFRDPAAIWGAALWAPCEAATCRNPLPHGMRATKAVRLSMRPWSGKAGRRRYMGGGAVWRVRGAVPWSGANQSPLLCFLPCFAHGFPYPHFPTGFADASRAPNIAGFLFVSDCLPQIIFNIVCSRDEPAQDFVELGPT